LKNIEELAGIRGCKSEYTFFNKRPNPYGYFDGSRAWMQKVILLGKNSTEKNSLTGIL
jgi:hypothetical protein